MSNLGVCPLENAPDKLELDSTLAGVLGHSTEYTVAENPDTEAQLRSQRSIDLHASSTSALSEPVRQLLLNRKKPQLSQEELSNISQSLLPRHPPLPSFPRDGMEIYLLGGIL